MSGAPAAARRAGDGARVLARGPWPAEAVAVGWRAEPFEPRAELSARADAAVRALRERGSPAHDGMAARLAGHAVREGRLELELQPARWALRLVEGDASEALTVLCAVRRPDGAWLAGRRAAWVATWAGRWALGAGGAVDLREHPVDTLARELEEEWRLSPEALSVEALLALPGGMAMLVGVATVPDGSRPVPDAEHDELAWWPADVERWPPEAGARLRALGRMLHR
jgi:8-oxo-dGTP diphosphatase